MNNRLSITLSAALWMAASLPAQAQTLGAEFASDYSAVSLGSVPGLPNNYGGLTLLDQDTLLIGGAANGPSGSLYTIDVTRDAGNHITGFVGSVARFGGPNATVGEYNDGGVTFGPGGVLFTSRWNINSLGQTKPGSMNKADYDVAVADLVAFLQWMGEPAQNQRVRMGVWVLIFLSVFTVIAWRLTAAFWKDVK